MDNSIFFETTGRSNCPFQLFIGGRGVGKTYSALRDLVLDENKEPKIPDPRKKFMYMRRMAKEIELCASSVSNPFKRINYDFGINIQADLVKKDGYAIFRNSSDEQEDQILGYGVALSTFAGLRGVDFSDVDTIVFDEFIPERHVRKIKGEGRVFLNMYETVNRNRELQGQEPVRVLLLANSISMASEILLEMGAVPTMADMILKGRHRATLKERGLYIELVDKQDLAEAKSQTALYKLTKGSDFNKEAILNQFTSDNINLAKKVAINEYIPKFRFCEYTFYQHKSRYEFYLAKRQDTAPIEYSGSDRDRLVGNFKYTYRNLVLTRSILFDDYSTKLVFDTLLEVN